MQNNRAIITNKYTYIISENHFQITVIVIIKPVIDIVQVAFGNPTKITSSNLQRIFERYSFSPFFLVSIATTTTIG